MTNKIFHSLKVEHYKERVTSLDKSAEKAFSLLIKERWGLFLYTRVCDMKMFISIIDFFRGVLIQGVFCLKLFYNLNHELYNVNLDAKILNVIAIDTFLNENFIFQVEG